MADDKKVTDSSPDEQEGGDMADGDKKMTSSTHDEQQDAVMIDMPEIFISDEMKESDEIARALRAMMEDEEQQNVKMAKSGGGENADAMMADEEQQNVKMVKSGGGENADVMMVDEEQQNVKMTKSGGGGSKQTVEQNMKTADTTDGIQTESNEIVQTGGKKGYYTNKGNSVKKVVGKGGKAGGNVSDCQPDIIIEEIIECDPTVRRRTVPLPPVTPRSCGVGTSTVVKEPGAEETIRKAATESKKTSSRAVQPQLRPYPERVVPMVERHYIIFRSPAFVEAEIEAVKLITGFQGATDRIGQLVDYPRRIVVQRYYRSPEAAMREFNAYSRGLGWNGHYVHVELVADPVVIDEAGLGQPKKRARKN